MALRWSFWGYSGMIYRSERIWKTSASLCRASRGGCNRHDFFISHVHAATSDPVSHASRSERLYRTLRGLGLYILGPLC